jgi:hypothetical protein
LRSVQVPPLGQCEESHSGDEKYQITEAIFIEMRFFAPYSRSHRHGVLRENDMTLIYIWAHKKGN